MIGYGPGKASFGVLTTLRRNSSELSDSFRRLSSGLRIESAADGAADLHLATLLRNDSSIFRMGARNVSDGISLFTIADSALTELHNIATRQKELAVQASNSSLSSTQRSALNTEANELVTEFNRIVATTEFNSLNPLDGSMTSISVQAANDAILLPIGTEFTHTIYTPGAEDEATGDFLAPVAYEGASDKGRSALGDFNGDGNLDIINAGGTLSVLDVYLGNGNGTFLAARSYANGGTTSYQSEIAVADLNGDGRSDILFGSDVVYLANSDGSFSYNAGANSQVFGVGDFNADSKLDIISGGGTETTGHLYLGNGNGSFVAPATFTYVPASGTDTSYEVADLNGDSKTDFIVVGLHAFTVYLGNGNGTFNAGTSFDTSAIGSATADLVDLDEDGDLDLVNGYLSGGTFYVHLSNGDGSFNDAVAHDTGYAILGSLSHSDFNDDGFEDIIGANRVILLGNGNGTFKAPQTFANHAAGLVVGDLNADGFDDFATTDSGGTGTLRVYLGNSNSNPPTSLGTGATMGELDLTSVTTAEYATDILDELLTHIAAEQGQVGGSISRLQVAFDYLVVARENFDAAYSRITDIDVAEELANNVRLQIINQAATAMLAQRQSLAQRSLDLLTGL